MSIANRIEPNVEILFQGQHILTVARNVTKVFLVIETIRCLSKHVRTSNFTPILISANMNVTGLYRFLLFHQSTIKDCVVVVLNVVYILMDVVNLLPKSVTYLNEHGLYFPPLL